MNEINRAARSRQRARLAEGEKPPAPRAALALAKSKTYQSAADAPETLRALQVRLRQLQRLVRGARLPAHCRPNRRRSARISPPQVPAMRYRRCVAGWPPSLANTGWPNNRSTRAIRRSARPCAASRAICSNSITQTRHAGGLHHDGLPQRRARRGDHGAHASPQPPDNAHIHQARKAGQEEPGRQAWPLIGGHSHFDSAISRQEVARQLRAHLGHPIEDFSIPEEQTQRHQ